MNGFRVKAVWYKNVAAYNRADDTDFEATMTEDIRQTVEGFYDTKEEAQEAVQKLIDFSYLPLFRISFDTMDGQNLGYYFSEE